ncbi:MAG TPA: glutaredoxin 3 [Caulobacteraceae bacterium]|nr:glutaredoxin 3 [Caulobacteraceae bacterium]
MAQVVIYTKPFCPYCARALALLERKGVQVDEIVASVDPEKRKEMMERSGRSTYPQIFIDGKHVGGSDDLHDLDRRGELDKLLAA